MTTPDPSLVRLRWELLTLYDRDPATADVLEGLYERHCDGAEAWTARALEELDDWRTTDDERRAWADDYLAGLHGAAVALNLRRLDPPRDDGWPFSEGERLIHVWCQQRARGFGWPLASGLVATVWPPTFPEPERLDAAMNESRVQVRERAKRDLQDRQDRLDRDVAAVEEARRAAGIAPPPGNAARDVRWLYRKLRGESFGDIAADELLESDAELRGSRNDRRVVVQRAVQRMARRTGIDATDW